MKCLILMSGGLDSTVAAQLMKDKGVEFIGLHFSGEPFTGKEPEEKTKKICDKFNIPLYVISFGKHQSEIVNKCKHKYYYVLSKRLMFRIAEKIAQREKCEYLVTGDNLGQVGSQTLQNMYVINKAIDMDILQPNLTFDKQEIIDLAKKFGTYELSTGPEMCSILGPKHPATSAKLKLIEEEEKNLNIGEMINDCLKNIIKNN